LNCKICDREAVEKDFCALHLKAYENIVKKYDFWRKALQISWKEYLSEIQQNSLTGEWAKEVANYLINNEGRRSVEES
jgi:hypothetical protein